MIIVTFTSPFIDTLTEDENAILHYVYYKKTKRLIDIRCVKVKPLYEMLLHATDLNDEGMQVLGSLFLKICTEYSLPTHGFENIVKKSDEPLFVDPPSSEVFALSSTVAQ